MLGGWSRLAHNERRELGTGQRNLNIFCSHRYEPQIDLRKPASGNFGQA